jgi:hypothetical protein
LKGVFLEGIFRSTRSEVTLSGTLQSLLLTNPLSYLPTVPLIAATMASPVIFVIGGGPRIGLSVARAFRDKGYTAVTASRNPDATRYSSLGIHSMTCDVTSTESLTEAFDQVRQKHGVPNVVVYNAAALTLAYSSDPFAMESEAYVGDLHVNLIGAYTALHETVKGWHATPTSADGGKRVFIATGNVTPFQPSLMAMTLGSGKAALAHLIEIGSKAYAKEGWRFYFASQVTRDGGTVPYQDVDGKRHGEEYLGLVQEEGEKGWDVRFVA